MSWHVTVTCDGHYHREPCAATFNTPDGTNPAPALTAAVGNGWRAGPPVLCPSTAHDEDQPVVHPGKP